MKTLYKYKINAALLFLLLSSITFANGIEGKKYKRTKTLTKEYTVSVDNTVDISNRHGDLTITTWNNNKVSIEVIITVRSSSEEAADKRFNSINVNFDQEENRVIAKTVINKKKFNWNFFGNSNSINTQIDYIIKMPLANHVDLKNDYGSIFIDKLEGKCKINCDYGSIRIGELRNIDNMINMDYGSSSSIDFIHNGKIKTDYSSLSIDNADYLKIIADYSTIEIGDVNNLSYKNDYGSLKINKVDIIKGNGDYLSLKVYNLHKSFLVDSDYGSLKIYKVFKGFDKISINSEYTGVKIGFEIEASFSFDLLTSYADIDFESLDVDFKYKENKMFSKHYKGFVNSENTKSRIIISSSYANIKLYTSKN
jgi:hypothetical protein